MAHSSSSSRGSTQLPWFGQYSSWGEGWSISTRGGWRDDRSVAATAAAPASGSADPLQRAKSNPAVDANSSRTRAGWNGWHGWRDEWTDAATVEAAPFSPADQWQRGKWKQGADPNLDTTSNLQQSLHVVSLAAATAANNSRSLEVVTNRDFFLFVAPKDLKSLRATSISWWRELNVWNTIKAMCDAIPYVGFADTVFLPEELLTFMLKERPTKSYRIGVGPNVVHVAPQAPTMPYSALTMDESPFATCLRYADDGKNLRRTIQGGRYYDC